MDKCKTKKSIRPNIKRKQRAPQYSTAELTASQLKSIAGQVLKYKSKKFPRLNKRDFVLNSIQLEKSDVSRQSNVKVVNYVKLRKNKRTLSIFSKKFFEMRSKKLSEKLSKSVT